MNDDITIIYCSNILNYIDFLKLFLIRMSTYLLEVIYVKNRINKFYA